MKNKKIPVIIFTVLSITLYSVFPVFANAQTLSKRIPTYGLYCACSEMVIDGDVSFDFTDTELLSHGIGLKEANYRVTANKDMSKAEFAIPFISTAREVPQFNVMLNGQAVNGAVWFGNQTLETDYSFDIENNFSPILDDNIIGTLYSVIPNGEIITISLSFKENNSFIYETSNESALSQMGKGNYCWTFRNAFSKPYYNFFVLGDFTEHLFDSSCEYRSEIMTCKDYICKQYESLKYYYDDYGGVPIDYLYSEVNKLLLRNSYIKYDELFLYSIDYLRLNAYKFIVAIDREAVINYTLPITVQRNYISNSLIYSVEHKQTGNYKTDYTVKLNDDNPYIIESNIKTEKSGLICTAETSEDFCFAFGATEKPIDTSANVNDGVSKTVVIFSIVITCAVLIVVAIVTIVARRQKNLNR